jgi:hypothetical protein
MHFQQVPPIIFLIFVSQTQKMKKLLYLPLVLIIASSCGETKQDAENTAPAADTSLLYFGDSITMENATPADKLIGQMHGNDSLKIKLSGIVSEVCQKKGCWMTMNIGNDKSMQIRFKDYGFFVPKDISGKTAVIEGVAFNDTIPVNELKHYAEDEGKSKEEIEKITDPEISISFEANGVIIKK